MSGRWCARSSIRDSDSRSSISRAMRQACACMMPRKRSRAAGSSRAGPCSVSMKPVSAASGVRSSWLTLATKSARISSTRRIGVRSCTVMTTMPARPGRRRQARPARRTPRRSAATAAATENSMRCALPVRMAARIASTSSGMRSAIEAGSPRRSAGAIAAASRVEGDARGRPDPARRPDRACPKRRRRAGRCPARRGRDRRRRGPQARRAASSSRAPSRRLSRPIQPSLARRHRSPTSRRSKKCSLNSRMPSTASASVNGMM